VSGGAWLARAPRSLVITLVVCVLALLLALVVGPAVASLEPPEVGTPTEVKATTATLQGVLDPTSTGELGASYQFIYRASSATCQGAGEVKSAEGLSLGEEHEAVGQAIEGLAPNTEYTVCLAITNSTKTETVLSLPLTFKTALAPEVPAALKAEPLTATTATLHGVLNPNAEGNPGSFEFLYRESSTECQGEGGKATAAEPASGEKAEPAAAEVSELLPNATYAFCLLARNEAGETALSSPLTFTTLAVKPTLASEATTNVTETSADLTAQINPNGAATTYQMEYGTTTAYGSSTPLASVGQGHAPVAVSQPISVFANTTYHWRLHASNVAGPVTSSDHTFVDDTAGTTLPDGRAYEMVTPAQKNGALIEKLFVGGAFPQVAANGQRVIAVSTQCFADPESCRVERRTEGEPYAFERGAGGWTTHPLAPPESFETNSLWTVSADADTVMFSVPRLPPGLIEEDFYGREEHGAFLDVGPVGEHTSYGQGSHVGYVASTRDLSHVLYQTNGRSSVWSFNPSPHQAVYEYTGTGNAAPLMVGVRGSLKAMN
jgi:hypothetical protein